MVKVTDLETGEASMMADEYFGRNYGRFLNDEEIEALHAGDLVCVEVGDRVFDAEVVR